MAKASNNLPTEKQKVPSALVTSREGFGASEADVWEKTEMGKIKEKYEKKKTMILEWENEAKAKAKQKLTTREAWFSRKKSTTKEGALESRRAQALQDYKSTMEMIDQIAGEVGSRVEEKRRKEEMKVMEKANKIRSTGKIPTTCFCF